MNTVLYSLYKGVAIWRNVGANRHGGCRCTWVTDWTLFPTLKECKAHIDQFDAEKLAHRQKDSATRTEKLYPSRTT